jgi:hypothetical protein
VVENVTLVAANDYTKNISELVFSPAVYVRPQTTLNGKAIPYKEVLSVRESIKRLRESSKVRGKSVVRLQTMSARSGSNSTLSSCLLIQVVAA